MCFPWKFSCRQGAGYSEWWHWSFCRPNNSLRRNGGLRLQVRASRPGLVGLAGGSGEDVEEFPSDLLIAFVVAGGFLIGVIGLFGV